MINNIIDYGYIDDLLLHEDVKSLGDYIINHELSLSDIDYNSNISKDMLLKVADYIIGYFYDKQLV